jgi:hypothetical protein
VTISEERMQRVSRVAKTHGGKAIDFDWSFQENLLVINSNTSQMHEYTLQEIVNILSILHSKFGNDWFPLANNIEKMPKQKEKLGLGSIIYSLAPGKTHHAQGASYLGIILEETGILKWNRKIKGIEWQIAEVCLDSNSIQRALKERLKDNDKAEEEALDTNKDTSPCNTPDLTIDDLANMRRQLIQILNSQEGVSGQQREGVASRIRRLMHSEIIPREIAAFMLAVSEARNVTEYQAKVLSSTEREAAISAWKAVLEWAQS